MTAPKQAHILPDSWPAALSSAIAIEISEHVREGNVTLAAGDAARVATAFSSAERDALRALNAELVKGAR